MTILNKLPDYTNTGFLYDPAAGRGTICSSEAECIGRIVSDLLPYVYVIAGLLMLVMLIVGGVTLMTAAGDQNKTKEGYGKIQAGIIGFIIIFISFFVVQIVEVVLGVRIIQ